MNQRTLDKLKEHSHGNDTNHASQTGVISKNEEVVRRALIDFGRFRGDVTDDPHKGHASAFGTQSTESVAQLIRSNEAIDAIIRTWMANDPNAPIMYTTTTPAKVWEAAAQTFTRYSSAVWGCCCDRYSTPSHSP
jgi:hypothetical protein